MIKTNKIRLYYGIFLAVLTVAVGVAFIIAVSQVYYGGIADNPDYPFQIERIRQYIVVPFVLLMCWIAAIIGGIVVLIVTPNVERKSAYTDNDNTLALLKKRLPTSGEGQFEQAKATYRKYQIARTCVFCAVLAVCLVAAIFVLVYTYGIANYHADDLHGDILKFARNVLIWTLVATACGVAGAIVDGVLLKRQITAAKAMIVSGDRSTVPPKKEISRKMTIVASTVAVAIAALAVVAYVLSPIVIRANLEVKQSAIYAVVFVVVALLGAAIAGYSVIKPYIPHKVEAITLWTTRGIVLVAAITFIVVGIVNGGASDVFIKAINICTECIGLG